MREALTVLRVVGGGVLACLHSIFFPLALLEIHPHFHAVVRFLLHVDYEFFAFNEFFEHGVVHVGFNGVLGCVLSVVMWFKNSTH